MANILVSRADTITFTGTFAPAGPFVHVVSGRDTVKFAGSNALVANRIYLVSGRDTLTFAGRSSVAANRIYLVSGRDTVSFAGFPSLGAARVYPLRGATTITFSGSSSINFARLVSRADTITFSGSGPVNAERLVSRADTVTFGGSGSEVRDVSASRSDAVTFGGGASTNRFLIVSGSDAITFASAGSDTLTGLGSRDVVAFADAASASVVLAGGGTLPGGDANAGLRAVAYPVVSGDFPMSFAETQGGLILIADGVDPMLRWDGLSATATTAGLAAPATPIALGGADVGTITGLRQALCRFVDRLGNPSNPSPISNLVNFGRDAFIEDVACDPGTGVVTITSRAHGLRSGEEVVIRDVDGPAINGTFPVHVLDPDSFTLVGVLATEDDWAGTGSWTWGIATVVYGNVPTTKDPKVARRQVLRNLDGDASVFYVDIDTADLTATTLSSTAGDEELSASEAVPLLADDDVPFAMRYGVPPSHKAIVCSFMGRIFAASDVAVTIGNAAPSLGKATVRGLGTDWRATFAGRFLYVAGSSRPYEIASIDEATQVATLTSPYLDPTVAYATYAIRPAPGERKLVYYSEPSLPEAWPPWNAFSVPEDDDEITGLFVNTSFLYIVEQRHVYRYTQQDEPDDGFVFLSINRGCLNGRCFAQADNTYYLLDEAGIYAFDGDQSVEPISTPIQTIFQADLGLGGLSVDWSADRSLWHAALDAVRTTIRWFVQMLGTGGIYHAICYDYRQRRWWVESYPSPITSSATGTIGQRRSLVGTDARRVLCLAEGALDVVADSPALGGTLTGADADSLSDSSASFPANLAGVPVAIATGAGRGQRSVIADNTSTTLAVVEPWAIVPAPGDTYQVGGVPWSWKSGWFDLLTEQEETNPRDVAITHQPTTHPASLDVNLYFDHADDPSNWGYAVSQDGVTILDGDPNVTVSLQARASRSGWALQRFGGHSDAYGYGPQFVAVGLSGVQGSESIRVFRLDISGARSGEDE